MAIDNGINWLMSEKKELWLKLLKKLSSETYNIYLGTGNHLDMETAPTRVKGFWWLLSSFCQV